MLTSSKLCRVCDAAFGRRFDRDGANYGVCSDCGALCKVLSEEAYHSLGATYDPGDIFDRGDEATIRQHLLVDRKREDLEAISRRLGPSADAGKRSLIDIGCGMGGYLLAGRELGFEVFGVEPSESHSSVGRSFFDLPIRTAYFDPADYEGQTFDVVILSHVIEHIFDPRSFMRGLATIVKPGGVLVVITPNADSTLARITGSRWSMLAPLDHVTMMTPKALTSLKPAGFGLSVSSAEIVWEPAVVLLQALRDRIRAARVEPPAEASSAVQPDGARNSFRGTIAKINENPAIRIGLSIVSLPLWLINRVLGRAHCLTAIYTRAV